MADIDTLPQRGVPALALVDSTGVASNGSQTAAQLAARGVRSVCAVDATGVSVGGATVAQLASAGIRAFCPVDETGVAQDSTTALALRQRGIKPMVLLGNTGIALTGSATMLTLRQRGLDYFCPVDESGNATTMGAVVLISNSTVSETASIGTTVGTLSVAGGTGTYTFSLLSNPGGLFATAGTNGVNLNVAAALTAGTAPITVRASGGVPTPVDRIFSIAVTSIAGSVPLAPSIVWDGDIADTTPDFAVDLPLGNGAPGDAAVGDVLRLQWQLSTGGAFTNYLTHTLTQSDLDGNPITQSGLTPLAAGASYNFQSRLERGALISFWSSLASVTIASATLPVNTVPPVISGTTTAGSTLTTTSNGTWTNSPTGYTYQWNNAGSPIGGATSSTYVLALSDAGASITCVVTASNAGGSGSPATSNALLIDVSIVYLTNIVDATDLTTYSGGVWSGVTLGTVAANRKIVVAFCARSSSAGGVSSATLDGSAMTSAATTSAASGQNKTDILIINKPAGATGNLSITYAVGQQRCGAGLWAIYGANNTPTNTQTGNTGAGAVGSFTLVVPAHGVGIAAGIATFGAGGTATWTGLAEDYDATVETNIQHSGAHGSTAGSIASTITWSVTPSTVAPFAAAAWGP